MRAGVWVGLCLTLLGCEAATAERHVERSAPEPPPMSGEHECEQCHPDEAEQWAGSRHHTAFSNADFQRAFAREPLEFCRDCHAPAGDESRGVGCLDCHAGGRTRGGADVQAAPHLLRPDPEFGTDSCARCHEFEFPPESWRERGTQMQTTMTEHRAWQARGGSQSCADCHMPAGSHAFASTRDDAAMRRALSVSASRDGDTLVLELVPHDLGHAFPTGDLFRRLELHAELVGPDGEVLASTTRYLARHFRPRRRRDGLLDSAADVIVDDRVTEPTQLRLRPVGKAGPSGPPGEAALVWWVDYERVDQRNTHAPERSTLAGEVRLAEGRL